MDKKNKVLKIGLFYSSFEVGGESILKTIEESISNSQLNEDQGNQCQSQYQITTIQPFNHYHY